MLEPLDILQWKWDSISMDFVTHLSRSVRGHDSIWVIVDRLTNGAHFLLINQKMSLDKLAELYVREIVRLHGVPASIVSDRDPRFTSRFQQSLQKALGTQLRMSSAYHPQTDGQSERTIQSLEDLLRTCVLDHLGTWSDMLPLVEFTYNNSYHSSIGMAPYEALYGKRCRTPLCLQQDGESVVLGPEFLQQTTKKVKMIQDRMRATQSRQKSYGDKRRRPLEFEAGDHVFLRVTSTTCIGRALKSRKLTPRFIGPYQITRQIGPVAYEIALPPHLANLHNVFHVSQLRKYIPDPAHVLEEDDVQIREDLTIGVGLVRILDSQVKQLRGKEIRIVKVLQDETTQEMTWEMEDLMRKSYPHLFTSKFSFLRTKNFKGDHLQLFKKDIIKIYLYLMSSVTKNLIIKFSMTIQFIHSFQIYIFVVFFKQFIHLKENFHSLEEKKSIQKYLNLVEEQQIREKKKNVYLCYLLQIVH